jgi:N-formylglutamate deformylase
MAALIVHVPHASVLIPAHALVDYCVDAPTLRHELARLTDWYTDELFTYGFPDECVSRADVSRLVTDVERFADDGQEGCSKVGMGATYTRTSKGAILRDLSHTRREQLLAQ